ncbi:MAG: hypothetical protein J2P20_12350 [Pseudonocardia sp.]|nr:hypothetical protein [Pseudonocardia sp.]
MAGAVVGAAAASLTSCAPGEPDPLKALAARARADAALINEMLADPATGAALSDRLSPVADARGQHAKALAVELGETATPTPAPASGPPPPPDPKAALTRVRAALDVARQQAAALVPTLPRRRAALVGSIAACCAAYREVLG